MRSRVAVFRQKLEELGWVGGRNLQIDVCWSDLSVDRAEACAAKFAAFNSDVMVSSGPEALLGLRRATHTIPIVFMMVGEPVESGVVSSLARPDRNVTGLAAFEYSIASKWIELLKQFATDAMRVGVLRHAAVFTHPGYLRAIEAAAQTLGVSVLVMDAGNSGGLESSMKAFARESDGLMVLPSPLTTNYQDLIVSQANRYWLPAVYAYGFFAANGGLLSYGNNVPETLRLAAGQVDRILRGASVTDLPVQEPSKLELVVNLKTAKAIGIVVPPWLLTRADEVIE
jgi:putative tryptophan/tyrosine transport system substrate-binding protein